MRDIWEGDEYVVNVKCPHCGQNVGIETVLDGVLKVRAGKATLSVAAKTLRHYCGQQTIDELEVDQQTGEVLNAPEAVRGVRMV